MTYEILWQFEVPQDRRAEFEAAYGPHGAWAKLFAKAGGFVEVRLLRSAQCYITVDRWVSQQAFEAFRVAFAADYRSLDEKLEGLATGESRIGAFESD